MLHIKLLSPTGLIFEGEVLHATFPGEAGSFGVYPSHAPLIATLGKGEIVCWIASSNAAAAAVLTDEEKRFPVESGFVEVLNDNITACIET